jgi:hypothetical protein
VFSPHCLTKTDIIECIDEDDTRGRASINQFAYRRRHSNAELNNS